MQFLLHLDPILPRLACGLLLRFSSECALPITLWNQPCWKQPWEHHEVPLPLSPPLDSQREIIADSGWLSDWAEAWESDVQTDPVPALWYPGGLRQVTYLL